eukprot:6210565-Lingulodinium_polyedra.AAC.1
MVGVSEDKVVLTKGLIASGACSFGGACTDHERSSISFVKSRPRVHPELCHGRGVPPRATKF